MRAFVIALGLLVAGQAARAVPEPLLWWSFDDGLRPTHAQVGDLTATLNGGGGGPRYLVKDAVGGASLPALDCNGDALRFSGDDYVEAAGGLAGYDGFQAMTLAAWVRLDAYNGAVIAKYDTHNQWVSYYLGVQSINGKVGYLRTLVGGAGGVTQWNEIYVGADSAANAVPLNQWTHIAVVWSGGTNFEFYVNGVPWAAPPFSSGNFTGMYVGTTPISIGSITSASGGFVGRSDFLVGDIDDPRIWNVALSAADIATLASGGDTVESCAMCPIDCSEEPVGEVFYGVVANGDGTLGSIQCWHDADGIDCRKDLSGALLVGPPECAP
jgi:hypothetical protein